LMGMHQIRATGPRVLLRQEQSPHILGLELVQDCILRSALPDDIRSFRMLVVGKNLSLVAGMGAMLVSLGGEEAGGLGITNGQILGLMLWQCVMSSKDTHVLSSMVCLRMTVVTKGIGLAVVGLASIQAVCQ